MLGYSETTKNMGFYTLKPQKIAIFNFHRYKLPVVTVKYQPIFKWFSFLR